MVVVGLVLANMFGGRERHIEEGRGSEEVETEGRSDKQHVDCVWSARMTAKMLWGGG